MELIQFENSDGKFLLYRNDAIANHLFRGDLWEPHFKCVAQTLLPVGKNVIDCGSNFGYNAVVVSRIMQGKGKLFCFEPQNLVYEQLVKNLSLNGVNNAICYQNCLGESSGIQVALNPVDYNAPWVNIGDTSIGLGGEYSETISIDDLNISDVGFIKLDVQGYELFVLRGAEKTILKDCPILFIELEQHQLKKFNCAVDDVISYLRQLKYKIFNIDCGNYKDDYLCVGSQVDINLLKQLSTKINIREIE